MTQVTPNATPKRLKKRNLGKLATAGVATFAGLALAATTFSLVQDGSAEFTPTFEEGFVEASADSVSVSEYLFLDVKNSPSTIGPGAEAEGDENPNDLYHDADTEDVHADELSGTFTITNESDERAIVALDSIVSDDMDDALYESIEVIVIRDNPRRQGRDNEVYRGKLAEMSRIYMGELAPRAEGDGEMSTQTFHVYAWSPMTTENETPELMESDFEVTYDVYGFKTESEADYFEAEFRRGVDDQGGDSTTANDAPVEGADFPVGSDDLPASES